LPGRPGQHVVLDLGDRVRPVAVRREAVDRDPVRDAAEPAFGLREIPVRQPDHPAHAGLPAVRGALTGVLLLPGPRWIGPGVRPRRAPPSRRRPARYQSGTRWPPGPRRP